MECPEHEIEMVPDPKAKGRLICPIPECGYNGPPRRGIDIPAIAKSETN